MNLQNRNNIRLFFYSAWIVVSLFQIGFTELLHDEAYYWMYSRHLSWGYFDHPPMIAILIRMGFIFFHNEFGVRLLPMLMGAGTIYLTELLVRPANLRLFYTLVASVAFLHLANILAIPDTPLLFFSVLFLHAFKKYSDSPGGENAVLLALSMGGMLYSKYHGILMIAFAIFTNIRLLKNKSFGLALLVLFLLMTPHLSWQISNNFPSLKYHLFDRTTTYYSVSNTLIYLATQPFIFGPFFGILAFYTLFVFRPQKTFERTLRFTAIGIYLFFLVMTLKGPVEGNWTVLALVPSVFLVYTQAIRQASLERAIYFLFPISMILIFGARIYMVYDFLPSGWKVKTEVHNNREWARQMEEVAGNRPVAFMNSYQLASKYSFYSGRESFSLNNAMGRENQYSTWDSEYDFQGKDVFLVLNYHDAAFPVIPTAKGNFQYTVIENFRSYGNIRINAALSKVNVRPGEYFPVRVNLNYTNTHFRNFQTSAGLTPCLSYVILQGKKKIAEMTSPVVLNNASVDTGVEQEITVQAPFANGDYDLFICVKTGWLPAANNGCRIRLSVGE